jgi:AraC-like DNA-binding protein
MPANSLPAVSRFWRDPAVPFIEARDVTDGRLISHAAHAHETFSIGAVTAGQSTYINGDLRCAIAAGTVVLMNPGAIHACNPLDDQAWAYHMLYVDVPWLAALQAQLGISLDGGFVALASLLSTDRALFEGLVALFACLTDAGIAPAAKHQAAQVFFSQMLSTLAPLASADAPCPVASVVAFIRAHCTEPLTLEQMAAVAGWSPSYLIRAFKQRHGITPHTYLNDVRLQYARRQLREGVAIAEAAQAAGFADQAHLQRLFKRSLATTPGHYCQAGQG